MEGQFWGDSRLSSEERVRRAALGRRSQPWEGWWRRAALGGSLNPGGVVRRAALGRQRPALRRG